MRFRNPANGYEEEVTNWSRLFAFLFGFFYFAYKGLWRHVLIQLAAMWAAVSLFYGAAGAPLFFLWAGYAIAAPGLLRSGYLRKGWKPVGGAAGSELAREYGGQVDVATNRKCPLCAEEILPQALKCKHCGSDISATAET